jgi:glycosyltransferase involved in cell wall biosynthesis
VRSVPAHEVRRWQGKQRRDCVIIPVINEGERIQRLLARMSDIGVPEIADVIIVDGGSKDGSLDSPILEANRVAGLIVKTGPGKLSAQLLCAYAFALDQGYEAIVTIDGNDKDDPAPIPAFIQAIRDGYDFVQASRYVPGGVEENTPWKRTLAIRLVHAPLLSLASGFWWTDTTQGFRAYSRRLLEDPRLDIFRPVFSGYELLAYLSYRAPRLGYRCVELPTSRRYPKGEPTPTRINGLKGELGVLATLLRACTGRYDRA